MNEEVPSEVQPVDVEVTPVPALFYFSLFIPAFFVMVWVLQKIMGPRVPLSTVHPEDDRTTH